MGRTLTGPPVRGYRVAGGEVGAGQEWQECGEGCFRQMEQQVRRSWFGNELGVFKGGDGWSVEVRGEVGVKLHRALWATQLFHWLPRKQDRYSGVRGRLGKRRKGKARP